MNINIVKNEIENKVGRDVIIKYNLGRNKIEKYKAKIKEVYNYIFIVEVEDSLELKSFAYSDIITKTIKIEYK